LRSVVGIASISIGFGKNAEGHIRQRLNFERNRILKETSFLLSVYLAILAETPSMT
jgi:hypothetical protein